MSPIDDKVVVVTGGGSGMGLAMCEDFAAAGARVFGFCIDAAQREDFLAATGGSDEQFVEVDVADEAAVTAATARVVAAAGGVDALINNAAVRDIGGITDLPLSEWERVIAVDLTGGYICARAVVPSMTERGGGAIVNIASISSLFAFAERAAYTAAKHGVLGLTRSLALGLGPDGIRVNAICPGMIETPMTANYVNDPPIARNIKTLVPLGRAGRPQEVARVARFLISEDAAYVNGAVIPVDGGFSGSATWDPGGESAAFVRRESAERGSA